MKGFYSDRVFFFFLGIVLLLIIWSITITYKLYLNYPLEYDEGIYLSVARNIHETGFPVEPVGEKGEFFLGHPHFGLFDLSLWESIFGLDFVLIRLFHMLTWILPTIVIFFLFVNKLSNPWGGLLAVLLLISESFILHNAMLTKIDVPLMAMFTLFFFLFYLFYENVGGRVFIRWLILGGVFALAALTKYQATLMFIPVGVILTKHYFVDKTFARDNLLRMASGFIAGALFVIVPWIFYCTWGGGEIISVVSARIYQISHFDPLEYRNTAPILDYWKILFNRIGYPLIFIFGISVCLSLRTRNYKRDSFILLAVWIITVFLFFTFISTKSLTGRYYLPLLPAVILLSSQVIAEKLPRRLMVICLSASIIVSIVLQAGYKANPSFMLNSAFLLLICLILLIGLLVWILTPYFHLKSFNYFLAGYLALLIGIQGTWFRPIADIPMHKMPIEYASVWIKQVTQKGEAILTNLPQLGYFADRNYIFTQYDRTGEGILNLLDNKRIRVIYLDSSLFGTEFFDQNLPAEKRQSIDSKIESQFDLVAKKDGQRHLVLLYKRK